MIFFTWLRERRKCKRFSRALTQVAREKWNTGEIDTPQYAQIVSACQDPNKVKKVIAQVEAEDGLLGGIRDWNWETILDWVRANLIPALKIILPLLLLL